MYADRITDSMRRAIDETNRRRAIQQTYNEEHGVTPTNIKRDIRTLADRLRVEEDGASVAAGVGLALAALPPDEIARMIKEHNIAAADVEKVDVGGNHSMTNALLHHQPTTGLQGKFSMEFCVAILLLEHKAGLNQFLDPVVQRPDVQAMIKRVNFYVDPEAEAAGFDKMTSIIKIHMKGGKLLTGRAEFAKGSPLNPMSYDETADKFRGCAEFAKWPAEKTEQVIALVKSLESVPDISRLAALLTA